MKWIKEITLEDIFHFEKEVYKVLLRHYENCIDFVIHYADYEKKEVILRALIDDLHLAKKAIMLLLNDKVDTLLEDFKDEINHPIIYVRRNSWKTFKIAFNSLKERVIAYGK